MKKISLALLILIIVGICVPAVSAELLIDSDYKSAEFDVSSQSVQHRQKTASFKIYQIQDWVGLNFLYTRFYDSGLTYIQSESDSGYEPVNFYISGNKVGRGYAGYNIFRNSFGDGIGAQIWIDIEEWNVSEYIGTQTVTISPVSGSVFSGLYTPGITLPVNSDRPVAFLTTGGGYTDITWGYTLIRASYYWANEIIISDGYVELNRDIDGIRYFSKFETSDGFIDESLNYIKIPYSGGETWTVTNLYGRTFEGILKYSNSEDFSTNIYVRNTQTDALIANAHINISASVDNEFHEVINETIPGGIATYTLQPTGGGMPNPDFYRLIVTAEGYNSIMPYIDFEVDGATSIYAYLDPTGGAPEDENKTFIDFYVRDLAANGVSGVTVNFGGYTLITNSAGYAVLEVDKNKTYTWTVSKSGYGSLTGNAVIGSDGRHTINTVIAPSVTPTTPTPILTSTPISPTPTMTAPTGEPTSNLLEWFAAHFGMILGGGVEIGKIFMWLCFAVPVGVYVGKEAKAGAAGFMAGAGIVTLFFVLIGWVPIWLLVLLALIIGLLYAKVFNNSDNGGGR